VKVHAERERPPLAGLDLNLLVTLRALLREGSVTRAAASLGQGQPTVSRSLATLRAAFGDPLLTRSGRGMVATPFAVALRPALERSLASVDRLSSRADFSPGTSDRTFRVVLPDLLAALVLPELARRLALDAPAVLMQVQGHEGDVLAALLEDRVDLVVGAPVIDHPEFVTRRVRGVDMTWSVLHGPLYGATEPMDAQAWAAAQHVVLVPGGRPDVPGPLDRYLADTGIRRTVRLHVSHLSGLGSVLAVTPWVASLPTPVARQVALRHGLTVVPHPLADRLPTLPVRLTSLAVHRREPGHVWLHDLFEAVVAKATTDHGVAATATATNAATSSSSHLGRGSIPRVR
jgi:DNA-binding transcriptional LysR family regulator